MKDIILRILQPKMLITLVGICILLYGIYQGAVSIDEIIHWAGRVVERWKVNIDLQ